MPKTKIRTVKSMVPEAKRRLEQVRGVGTE